MALSASVTNVESLPRAFSTVMSELDIPAASAAFLMSGASNSTYRVELVVSGRIAAIFPCPAATNGLSAAIAVKSFVNCVVEMVGVDELVELDVVVVLVVELDDDELPHPAATSAIADVSTMAPNQRVLKLHAPRSSAPRSAPPGFANCWALPQRRYRRRRWLDLSNQVN